jgi:hypothetical protein
VQPDPRPELSPVRVQHVLALAQKRAERLGGTAQAAIWMAGWPKPVVTGSEAPMRMWSMSKVVVSLAMLQASGGRLSSESRDAMRAAITRSDNCAIRRVTLGLQDLTHGTEGARAGFDSVLAAAGIHTPRVTQQQTPEPVCQRYLQAHGHNLKDPMGVAVLFGTAEWTLTDAVQFARALADGKYGRDGEYVLRLMSEPKERDPHLKSFEFTADVDFGAGRALSRWSPAYKSGWGGSQNGSRDYLLGQIVVPTGLPRKVAMAVAFHPDVQPLHDDPGATDAPMALETMLSTLDRGVLSKLGAP